MAMYCEECGEFVQIDSYGHYTCPTCGYSNQD